MLRGIAVALTYTAKRGKPKINPIKDSCGRKDRYPAGSRIYPKGRWQHCGKQNNCGPQKILNPRGIEKSCARQEDKTQAQELKHAVGITVRLAHLSLSILAIASMSRDSVTEVSKRRAFVRAAKRISTSATFSRVK